MNRRETVRGVAALWEWASILVGALMLSWPAWMNRFPILFPDSLGYLQVGYPAWMALLHHQRLLQGWTIRSEIYSLGIYLVDWGRSPWPIVALQAVMTSYVIWLVMRFVVPGRRKFLGVMVVLSALTSVSWFVSLLMPDILGALVYLCIYLLVFAWSSMSPGERAALGAIAWWGATSHLTHLFLAVGLLALLLGLYLVRWWPLRVGRNGLVMVAMVLVVAGCSEMAVHRLLYGKATLKGQQPPFLMARFLADGPASRYLEQHCGELKWTICKSVGNLPKTDLDFLWSSKAIWQSASAADQASLQREEMPLVLATWRTYPWAQTKVSLKNFWDQMMTVGVQFCGSNPLFDRFLNGLMPGTYANYERSMQAFDAIPFYKFTVLQRWVDAVSGVVALGLMVLVWRKRRGELMGLAVVIVSVVLANALLTGATSTVDNRYQSRVVWLIPLLVMVLGIGLFDDEAKMAVQGDAEAATEPDLQSAA